MGVVLGIKEDNERQPVRVDGEGRVYVVSNVGAPLVVTNPDGSTVGGTAANGQARTASGNAVAITASSQSQALPISNGTYILQAVYDDAFILTGTSPTAAISAGNFSLIVPTGQTVGPVQLEGDDIAWIGTTTGGFLVILPVED